MGFDDILEANAAFARGYRPTGRSGVAARGLAVLTCIDSRLDPLAMLGLAPGDAKIVRNAGARVTDDALRSLALATHLLGARRICVIGHTDCRMAQATQQEILAAIGPDAPEIDYRTFTDHASTIAADIGLLRASRLIPDGVVIGGFIYDVASGSLEQLSVTTV